MLILYSAENNGLSCSSEYQFNMKSEWLPYHYANEYDYRSRLKMIFISMSLVFSSVTHAAEHSNGLPSSVMSASAIRDSNMQACAERLHFDSVQDYIHYLDTHNIDMDSITENGVPALYCKDLPLDMKKSAVIPRKIHLL
ncbi:hypothetical protein PCI56_28000 [Plesiomonas shigelloides subsp. oncorhynchi]|nr:hypothetical protein [Plesiomonas shigelloides]